MPQPQLPVLEHYQTPALEGHPDVFDSVVQNQFRADLAAQMTPWISEPRVLGWSVGNEVDEQIHRAEVRAILNRSASVAAKRAFVDQALSNIMQAIWQR